MGQPPLCPLRKRKLIQLPAKQKRAATEGFAIFMRGRESAARGNETIEALALVRVVSRVLIGVLQIFVKSIEKRRDC
ncbi:hypothetical protein X729_20235 [Mesorhizobium sp. L103C131B0]|nr:hypothetical protein X729_20235 [Mesorhizobium sp. L103C131B0]